MRVRNEKLNVFDNKFDIFKNCIRGTNVYRNERQVSHLKLVLQSIVRKLDMVSLSLNHLVEIKGSSCPHPEPTVQKILYCPEEMAFNKSILFSC